MTKLGILLVLLVPVSALAGLETETFDNQQNVHGWSFGRPMHFAERSEAGGAQGFYLYTDDLVTFSPFVSVERKPNSLFTGNFAQRGVTSVSIDIKILESEWSAADRPLAFEIVSDNDTPNLVDDDWSVYILSDEFVPEAGSDWKRFTFRVPSRANALPTNWQYLPHGPQSPSQPNWGKLLGNVTEIGFRIGDPSLFYLLMGWKIGVDNISIETE